MAIAVAIATISSVPRRNGAMPPPPGSSGDGFVVRNSQLIALPPRATTV